MLLAGRSETIDGMASLDRNAIEDTLDAVYLNFSSLADGLADADAMRPSRCASWAVIDVLYHQLMDARRALCAFATPSQRPPSADYVSYWLPWSPSSGQPAALGGAGAAGHARHVRIAASAYSPAHIANEWRDTAESAVRAARACGYEALEVQGNSLPTGDYIATLVVEGAIHYLDITVSLPGAPAPWPPSLALVRQVLEALAGSALPTEWDDATCALKGTGRLPLTEADRQALGLTAAKLPLFG